MTAPLVAEFHRQLEAIERDPQCRVLVLTGAGRAFCAGLDLRGYGDDELVEARGKVRRTLERQREIAGLTQRLHELRQPVIAAVNGPAAGGGMALALASDIRIASTSALFAVSFIRAGFSACDLGTSWLLPRIVGTGRAHELMLTGRRISAEEALRIGLVTELVEPGDLMPNVLAKAAEIMLNPPISVELTKQGMWTALETPSFSASVEFENRQQVLTAMTDDQAEAAAAFLGKRAPSYHYR
jgi:enoyl-CoA hydratase/carnithine racemase